MNQVHIDTDDSGTDEAEQRADRQLPRHNDQSTATTTTPVLFHKVKDRRSILALIVSDSRIFAGTQGGEIIVSKNKYPERPCSNI